VILGLIIAIVAIVAAIAVTATALTTAKESADKKFSDKPVGGSEEPCPLADLTVVVVRPDKTGDPNFENNIIIEKIGGSSKSASKQCDEKHTFAKIDPGSYKVSAKAKEDEGYCFEKPVSTSLAEGEKKEVTLTLTPINLVEVTPKTDCKQYVNLDADAAKTDHGRKYAVEAKIDQKKAGITVYFGFEPGPDNRENLDSALEATITKSAKTDVDGIAKVDFTLSRYGGDTFKVLASLSSDLKHPSATVIKSKGITVWRRLWYQLNHHQDITPPSMASAISKIKQVYIDFVAETPVKHSISPAGSVVVGRHNAATYHAKRNSNHNARSVHIILCDKQIDGNPGLTNEVEVEFEKATDYINATTGGTYIIMNPPLQAGAKLFISGSWNNVHTGKSGTLTDVPADKSVDIGVVSYNNKNFMKVELPTNAAPTASKKVKVKIKITVSSGPWGGDGGTAPHNLVVISANDTVHTMCVLHELGHLMNMGPMAYSVNCPPGFNYTDHTKMYKSNGAHCYSGGTLVGGKGKDGTCIMYHQLNTSCSLAFCAECAPFVRAQKLTAFKDLAK
jgi:hypothetical protein